jgi:hypothetical protein
VGKTPDERRVRRQKLEKEFVDNVEQVLGFPLMEWQKPLILAVRRASLEGKPLDVKAMVAAERRHA